MKKKTSRQINSERKQAGLPPLNFALFRKVIRKLEAAPMAYDQGQEAIFDDNAPCGTAACIGGWADILSGRGSLKWARVDLDRAAESLGLTGENWVSEYRTERAVLFDPSPEHAWPSPFNSQWEKAKTQRGQARVAIRYLTHILNTGKVTE
jgi:hypothetical protein